MKVVFLGVGEACDEQYPNTSIYIQSEVSARRRSVLLDCGFTVPPLHWQHTGDPEDLDALWISHFHGDHFFGTPALLLRFWERKRQKPLTLVGPAGVEDLVRRVMELAYPGFLEKLTYPLRFMEADEGLTFECAGLYWSFARNLHGQRDLAVRVEDGRHSVFYSGDGLFTEKTVALARGCDLAIHEAFRLEGNTPGHGTVAQCVQFARMAGVKRLALVHVQRDERRERSRDIMGFLNAIHDVEAFLPEPGHEVELSSDMAT